MKKTFKRGTDEKMPQSKTHVVPQILFFEICNFFIRIFLVK